MIAQQLPNGWQLVKFGEIAKNISRRVEPSETDLDIYVGLEHLDPDSLSIQRHGVPSDVAGQKLKVKKGQIIFGKRRAYQRKVAVADWDCICSAHAMVLEEKTGKIVSGFLPFFMRADLFMNRAVAISEGSLSPTIKWKVLEQQEFIIPGLELQKDLLPIFHSSAKIERDALGLIDSLSTLRKLLMTDLFKCSRETWVTKPLGEVFEVQLGKMLSKKSTVGANPKPYLANFNVQWGRIEVSELKKMDFNTREMNKFRLKKGDILVCEGGEIGRSAVWNDEIEECYYQKALHRLRPINDEEILPEFMLIYMDFMFNVSGEFSSQVMATTIAHIPREKLIKLPVSFPSKEEQLEIVKAVAYLDDFKVQMLEGVQRVKVVNQAVLAGGV